ncbi:MAG: c-type cytochrome [Alphaproteobacteria bacterium]
MKPFELPRLLVIVTAISALPSPAAPTETVENVYRLYCVQCHGTLGNGEGLAWTSGGLTVQPMNHTSPELMAKLSDEELRSAITEGGAAVDKSDLMPSWGKTLPAATIDQLVRYLRKLCKCEGRK